MKFGRLQRSFGLSILCHAIVVGIVIASGFAVRKAALPRSEAIPTLTLIPAPEETIAKPNQPAMATAIPALVQPLRPIPETPVEMPSPVNVSNQIPYFASKPVSFSEKVNPPSASAEGDGGALKLADNLTSQISQPATRAAPLYLKNPEPLYPAAARRRSQQGLVLLAVKVTAQGRAASVELKQSSGFQLLDEAALQAVRGWEFQPARFGSLAVESEIEVPVRFKLTD